MDKKDIPMINDFDNLCLWMYLSVVTKLPFEIICTSSPGVGQVHRVDRHPAG